MQRRNFIKTSAAIGAGVALTPYIMKGGDFVPEMKMLDQYDFLKNDNIMIIVELAGGNDGLNTIIQADNDLYHQLRPNIGISETDAVRFDKTNLYMHPALVKDIYNDGMMGLLKNGNLAVIEAVGYDEYTMSHFRGQDIFGSGQLSTDPRVKLLEGWIGKYFSSKLTNYPLEIPEHPLSISVGGTIPLALKSDKGDMGISIGDVGKFYQLGAGLTPKEALLSEKSFYADEFNFINVVARQSEAYSNALKNANDTGKNSVNYAAGGLNDKFKTIAKLISGGLKTKVYYVKQGGYDMHIQQMKDPFSGQHPALLNELSNAISTFMQDATKQGFVDRVAGLTITEFGRRAHDNGSRGSDHGSACVQFMFASDKYISGGTFGERPDLGNLDENTNIRHNFDFRRIYADFLENWFDAGTEETTSLFGEKVAPMGILKKRITSVNQDFKYQEDDYLQIFPNPSNGKGVIQFIMNNERIGKVEIYNLKGFLVSTNFSGRLDYGMQKHEFSGLESGTYIASVEVDGKRVVKQFVVAN